MNQQQMTMLARPYATAVFEEAVRTDALASWANVLAAAATVTLDKRVQYLLSQPHQDSQRMQQFYVDVLGAALSDQQKNFISLLSAYHRLIVLPEISRLFQLQREAFEKVQTVRVVSAVPLDETYRVKLANALTKKLARRVELVCEINESLLGGIVVTAGDLVMDGSVKGKLSRMMGFVSGIF